MLKMINDTIDTMNLEYSNVTTQETTQKTTQEKILNLINQNPNITQNEMAKKIGLTRDGVSYNIKILKEKGLVKRIGSTKNGYWKLL